MFNDKDWFNTPEIKKILESIFDDIQENNESKSEGLEV